MDSPHNEVLPQERQQRILALLKAHGRVVASELAARFEVSEDSIRRDLRDMAGRGLCRRVYGGALLPTAHFDGLPQRMQRRDGERSALASHAASLVQAGQTVLLDAGSTNVEIAQALRGKAVTVITNAPTVAAALCGDPVAEVVMIGGRVDPASGGAIGVIAQRQLAELQVDICIPGTCAVDPETGVWGIHAEEVAFKQAMIQASGVAIIVAGVGKLGTRATYRIGTLAGEGPFFVTKQFTFQQVRRNRATVDGDERVITPPAGVVNALREQFLAGPAQLHLVPVGAA